MSDTRRVYVPARERKEEIYRALKWLSSSNDVVSVRALRDVTELKSTASISRYLRMLKEEGRVSQTPIDGHWQLEEEK